MLCLPRGPPCPSSTRLLQPTYHPCPRQAPGSDIAGPDGQVGTGPCRRRGQAATLTVTTAGEIADTEPLSRAQCSPAAGDRNCDTLRDAINHAADGDTIVFGAALDGQTISLTRFTNCLDTGQAAGTTCLPLASWPGYVSQFGPSAFFISGKHITIDATANGLTPQGVSVQRPVPHPVSGCSTSMRRVAWSCAA